MTTYEAYKPTGIDWIGDIPAHWEMRKVSRSFSEIGSGTTPKADKEEYYAEGTINWINTGDLNDGLLTASSRKVTEKALTDHSTLKVYPEGTLLIAMYGATIGKVALTEIKGCTNQACCALARSEFFLEKFAFFWFIAHRHHIINLSYGGGQPNISQEIVRFLKIHCPPLEEQTAIAAYLDEKTAQLDTLLDRKRRLIDLLREEKAALINDAVTKGVRPGVPMKDSGVDWLGEVPAHWEVKKLKYLVEGRLEYGANEAAELEDRSLPRYIRITDFGEDGKLRDNTFKSLPRAIAVDYLLKEGDVLFARSGATVGKTFQFKEYSGEACFAGYLIRARPGVNLTSDFLYFFTKSGAYENWRNGVFSQATIQNIGADKYNMLEVPLPPLPEQRATIAYLNTETARIDYTISRIEREMELLGEYRTALISEVVTGKVKVV